MLICFYPKSSNDACDVAKKCATSGEESPKVSPGTRLVWKTVICILQILFAIRYASKNTHWLYCSKSRIGKKQNFVPIHCLLINKFFKILLSKNQ